MTGTSTWIDPNRLTDPEGRLRPDIHLYLAHLEACTRDRLPDTDTFYVRQLQVYIDGDYGHPQPFHPEPGDRLPDGVSHIELKVTENGHDEEEAGA